MPNLLNLVRPLAMAGLAVTLLATSPCAARAEQPKTNACGCYQNTAGECICSRKGKCDCPGECEPKGCEEKRQKQFQKELQDETRKAQEAEKKRQQEAADKERKAREAEEAAEQAANAPVAEEPEENPDAAMEKGKAKSSSKGKKADKADKAKLADKKAEKPAKDEKP